MDFLDQLNPAQRDAVLQVDGPLLILAGAGSGKTRVIAFRIAYLIGGGHADAREVVAVTFTNKAAEEMQERVKGLLGENATGAWISTFHAMCARLLRREAPAIGLSRDFVIYDSSDQVAAVKQVMRELGIDDSVVQPRNVLSRISHAKNMMQGPESFQSTGYNPREAQTGRIFEGYQRALAESGALDFDDLLLKTVELFDRSEEVRNRYASRFKFLLVDEYQDTNRPQYLLLRRLAEAHHNICVVGDPDQSIYKWRGADLRNIMDFEADYPDATVVRLEQNYRSTQVILDAASAVISQNRNRKEKRLWTDRKGGDKIRFFRTGDELEEADQIARIARGAINSSGETPMAVLYRTNAQSRVIEDAFRREVIPYRIIGGVRFYERKEIKDTLAYLKLLINPDDDVSLRRVINVPARGIGKGVMESLDAAPPVLLPGDGHSHSTHSVWARLVGGLDQGLFSGRAASSLRTFRDLLISLTDIARQEPVSIAIGKVLDRSGYLQALRDERSEEAEGRIENLMELVSAAKEYETRDEGATLGGFVDRLSLLSDVDESEGATDARVLMMTMHAAKGLEFPLVVIAGLEEGLFPHSRSADDEAELEEERRLCYVGMTRARRKLVLTSASRRRWYGDYRNSEPSRFIDEVPPDLMERNEARVPSFYQPTFSSAGHEFRPNPYRRQPGRVREETPSYAYEDEDQSKSGGLSVGMRVRHELFGVGTVVSMEPADGDAKLVVKFAGVGTKKLLAKYAKLHPA